MSLFSLVTLYLLFSRRTPKMPTWVATNHTQGELRTSHHHPLPATHARRLCLPPERPFQRAWARTSWITGVAGQALPALLHPWITTLLWAAPPAGRRGGRENPEVWVIPALLTAQRRSSMAWLANRLRVRAGVAPTLPLPRREAPCPALYKSTTPTTMLSARLRPSHESPARPGPVLPCPSSATAAMSVVNRPSLTGTTASSPSIQGGPCRPGTAATLRTDSVTGGSSSGLVAGHTVPPRTLFCYYSSPDQDPMESHTGLMEIGMKIQVRATILATLELALKTFWLSTIVTAAH